MTKLDYDAYNEDNPRFYGLGEIIKDLKKSANANFLRVREQKCEIQKARNEKVYSFFRAYTLTLSKEQDLTKDYFGNIDALLSILRSRRKDDYDNFKKTDLALLAMQIAFAIDLIFVNAFVKFQNGQIEYRK